MDRAGWIVEKAAFSNGTGGLSIEGTNTLATDPRDSKISWNIGVHSLADGLWRRYDWRGTVWADDRARKTFERLAGVTVEEAARGS